MLAVSHGLEQVHVVRQVHGRRMMRQHLFLAHPFEDIFRCHKLLVGRTLHLTAEQSAHTHHMPQHWLLTPTTKCLWTVSCYSLQQFRSSHSTHKYHITCVLHKLIGNCDVTMIEPESKKYHCHKTMCRV